MIPLPVIKRRFFPFFVREVFGQLHPGAPPLELTWYLLAMCHALEEVRLGNTRRLVVNVPPRHLKSVMFAVAACAWILGHDPSAKILVGTYNEDLARLHDQQLRQIMESAAYKAIFPNTVINYKRSRQLDLHTTAGGFRMAVTTGGGATGFGGDYIILDDCMKAQDADSEAEREKVERWYRGTIGTRLNNISEGRIVSIQQRLHEYDLAAVMLDGGATHLCLPAIAQKRERIAIGPERWHVREPGDVLDPVRQSAAALADKRREMGGRHFSAQYLQDPTPPEGNLVRLEWFGRYDERPHRLDFTSVVQSWDTAASVEPGSAYSVCTTWGFHKGDGRWYLLHVLRDRLAYYDLKRAVVSQRSRWRADSVVIEDATMGGAIANELRQERLFRPVLWPARASKEERLIAQTGQMEAGRVVLPNEAPWLDDYVKELLAAPSCRYWDQVDSTTQFLDYAITRSGYLEAERDPDTGRRLRRRRLTRAERFPESVRPSGLPVGQSERSPLI